MSSSIDTIIFDLGGVLIDWHPKYLYNKIFDSEEKMDWFLQNICTPEWNEEQDAGRSLETATEELLVKYPEWEHEIRAYYGRWLEMLAGPIDESVKIFEQLMQNKGLKIYALTNWSAETFPVALEKFPFLHWFHGRVVSGEEKMRKPFPEFYHRLLQRYQLDPARALFIDDNLRNVKAAEKLGVNGIHFITPNQLKEELSKWNIEAK